MVKISVVIPVYNVAEFLEEAISSLLNQTFEDFELICVNDGSKDNSLDILNDFAKKDSRVVVIDKENGGCGSARNRALDEAKGEYIYFFDPDDYILPDAFERLYENIVNNDSDLVLFKIAHFVDGEPVNYSNPLFNFDKLFPNADFDNFTFNYKDIKSHVLNSGFAPWSKLYRKEFLDRYDDFRFDLGVAFDDVPFHVKSLLRAEKISFSPDYYYHYRCANPNSVNNTPSNAIDIMKIVELVENFLKSEGYFEEFHDEFFQFKITQIGTYLVSSNSEEYFQAAKKILLNDSINDYSNVPFHVIRKYLWVVNSNSHEEYRLKSEIHDKYHKIQKINKKTRRVNKRKRKADKITNEIVTSTSWKVTKPIRKFGNIFKR